jgi:hypothetical protein
VACSVWLDLESTQLLCHGSEHVTFYIAVLMVSGSLSAFLVTCNDEYTFLLPLHFTLREWATAVMIIVVFGAMIMSYLSLVYISSFFLMTNEAMLMSYDDSSFL